MKAEGTWSLRKPTTDEIVELFVSKSSWHEHYTKLFPKVEQYEVLVDWLEQGEGALSNMDTWGIEKGLYSFKDLGELLATLRSKRQKKNKRKADSVDGGSHKKLKKTSRY